MSSLIDYEGRDCDKCGALGSLVPDGDYDVECLVCGAIYSLIDDVDFYYDEDEEEEIEYCGLRNEDDDEEDYDSEEDFNEADFLSE